MRRTAISKQIFWVLMGFLLVLAGCSSINKANSLYNQGKNNEALTMAISLLGDGDVQVQIQAIRLVGKIGGQKAGKALMPLLDDDAQDVKIEAVKSLGKMHYTEASEKLAAMVVTSKGLLTEALSGAFSKLGTPAVTLIIQQLDSPTEKSNHKKYRDFLISIGPNVAEAVANSMKSKSVFENEDKFQILIAIKNPKVPYLLVESIDDLEIGNLVTEGLIKLGSMSVVPVMKELQKRVATNLEKEALIKILGELKDQRAVPLLEKLTKDPKDQVRAAADFALTKIRGF